MLPAQDALDVRHRFGNLVLALGKDADRSQTVASDHSKARGVDRNENLIIGIAERRCLTLRFEDPNDEELNAANADVLAEEGDRKSTRLNSSHIPLSRMPSSA